MYTTGGKLLPKFFFCQILFITVSYYQSQESHLVIVLDRKLQFMNFHKKTNVELKCQSVRYMMFLASISLHNLRGQKWSCPCYHARHLRQIHWSKLLSGMYGLTAKSSVATLNICQILMRLGEIHWLRGHNLALFWPTYLHQWCQLLP